MSTATTNSRGDKAKAAHQEWMTAILDLTTLEGCERHAPYTRLPLEVNESALRSCSDKAIRQCLKPVVKVQRKLKKCGNAVKSWTRREKEAHDAFTNISG
jgi:hypothetical protein